MGTPLLNQDSTPVPAQVCIPKAKVGLSVAPVWVF